MAATKNPGTSTTSHRPKRNSKLGSSISQALKKAQSSMDSNPPSLPAVKRKPAAIPASATITVATIITKPVVPLPPVESMEGAVIVEEDLTNPLESFNIPSFSRLHLDEDMLSISLNLEDQEMKVLESVEEPESSQTKPIIDEEARMGTNGSEDENGDDDDRLEQLTRSNSNIHLIVDHTAELEAEAARQSEEKLLTVMRAYMQNTNNQTNSAVDQNKSLFGEWDYKAKVGASILGTVTVAGVFIFLLVNRS